MPKRGGQRNNYNNNSNRFGGLSSYSDEHDDRVKERTTIRRVSFKPSILHQKRRMEEMAIRSRLEDDEDMNDFLGGSRFDSTRSDRGRRRRGSPIPLGKFGGRKVMTNALGWYQVTMNVAQKYAKDDVIRQILTTISPEMFIPLYWRTEKHCVIFFVTDHRIAEILQNADRQIVMFDGFKLPVRVRPGTPMVPIDEPYKEKIKLAMSKRYNPNTRALNLSKFYADDDFKDMFLSLARAQMMSAVIEIIEKNIPELVALNLNDNQIVTMETFKNIEQRLPHLSILYLEENRIPSVAHLLVFRNANITELSLKSNPLRNRYKDQSLYTSGTLLHPSGFWSKYTLKHTRSTSSVC